MLPWILIRTLFTLITSLLLSNTPLTTGLLILLIALCTSTIYATLLSSWFAFLIFLIYIGGILVIFSYFVALTPNQEKHFITLNLLIIPIIIILTISIFSRTPHIFIPNHSILFLFLSFNSSLLILLALLLFLTIVIIVKITMLSKGALRAFIYV